LTVWRNLISLWISCVGKIFEIINSLGNVEKNFASCLISLRELIWDYPYILKDKFFADKLLHHDLSLISK
jgi:hypothetical protein